MKDFYLQKHINILIDETTFETLVKCWIKASGNNIEYIYDKNSFFDYICTDDYIEDLNNEYWGMPSISGNWNDENGNDTLELLFEMIKKSIPNIMNKLKCNENN